MAEAITTRIVLSIIRPWNKGNVPQNNVFVANVEGSHYELQEWVGWTYGVKILYIVDGGKQKERCLA